MTDALHAASGSRSRVASHDAPTINLPDNGDLMSSPNSRRPRAGTMPSMLGTDASKRPDALRRQLSGLSLNAMSNTRSMGDETPPSTHLASGHSLLVPSSTSAASRLRSGSLTLPMNGIGNAFGQPVFSTRAWTPTDNSGQPSPSIPEELRSPASDDDNGPDAAGTLDYLGLIGSPMTSPTISTTSGPSIDAQMRVLQAASPIDSPNRLRANTVAVFPRAEAEPSGFSPLLPQKALLPPQEALAAALRPRAATVGLLHADDSASRSRAMASTSSANRSPETMPATVPESAMSRGPSRGQEDYGWSDNGVTHQLPPSRCLWVGNLDSRTGATELRQTFAPYGSIESIRVLPEKECAFVNFTTLQSAIDAREDVLNRLGGQITRTPGIAVRIGFGKSDPPSLQSTVSNSTALGTPPLHQQQSEPQNAPSRALWVGSLPPNPTPNDLLHIFGQWGPVESARVLTHKSCAFVNYERLDDAVRAKKALNGREIFGTEVGAVKVGFAKIPMPKPGTVDGGITSQTFSPSAIAAASRLKGAAAVPPEQQQQLLQGNGPVQDYRSSLLLSMVTGNAPTELSIAPPPPLPVEPVPELSELQLMMRELAPHDASIEADLEAVADFPPPASYYTHIGPPPTAPAATYSREGIMQNQSRMPDVLRLRNIRKKLDEGHVLPPEIESLVQEVLEDAAVLAADYIGNTIIQKLYELAGKASRIALLERIGPHMASIVFSDANLTTYSDLSTTPEEVHLICRHLKPFIPPLLLDQFGNYVVGCTLKFGVPASNMVFDAMFNRCWDIAQGRFGARGMRTCLESPHTPRLQQKRIAIAIILNAIPLSTNPNGALLLTWLLDTSNFSGRYRLLAPRFASHVPHLCVHKLASTTVLRLINQKVDPIASTLIIDHIFEKAPQVLEDILGDQVQGITFIQKVMASPTLSNEQRQSCIAHIERTVESLGLSSVPAYSQFLHVVTNGQSGSAAPPPVIPATPPQARNMIPRQNSPHGHMARSSPAPMAGHPGWASPAPPFYSPYASPYVPVASPPLSVGGSPQVARGAADMYNGGMPYFTGPGPEMMPPQMMGSPGPFMRRSPGATSQPMHSGYYAAANLEHMFGMPYLPPQHQPQQL